MQQEELDKVHKLVSASNILSPDEKKEWLQLLPEMNHKQVLELIKILSENEPAKKIEPPINPAEQAAIGLAAVKEKTATPAWHLPVDIKQKELATSLPEYELELPAPHQAVPASSEPIKPNPVIPANVNHEEVQKKVEQIMQEMRKTKEPANPPLKAAPAPTPGVSPATLESLLKAKDSDHLLSPDLPKAAPAPIQPKAPVGEPLVLKKFEDLSGLNPNMLHGQNAREVYQKILNTIPSFVRKRSSYEVISQLEESRLYKTYVSMGIKLLNDINVDRDLVYQKIINEASHTGQDYLTKEEFELFMDFRKELDKF